MLMSNNYCVALRRPGKHNLPWEYYYNTGSVFLVIQKRIDHWLNSIYRNPVNLPEMRPKLFKGGELVIQKAVELYGDFYDAWAKEHSVMVDYTELLRDPIPILSGIAREHNWRRHPAQEWNFAGPDKLSDAKRAFYLDEM
jgi:hypothetical protein